MIDEKIYLSKCYCYALTLQSYYNYVRFFVFMTTLEYVAMVNLLCETTDIKRIKFENYDFCGFFEDGRIL